jgi:predicted acylesterase/phospholipase RssA
MRHRKILDVDAVLNSPTPLCALVTRTSDYQAVILDSFSSEEELRQALRASARIPFVGGRPVIVDGVSYVDGALTQSIPVRAAIQGGATHILALLSRPRGELRGGPVWWERRGLLPLMNLVTPGLGNAHLPGAAQYKQELVELDRFTASRIYPPFAYMVQVPEAGISIKPLEQNPEVLRRGATAGAAAVHAAFDPEPMTVPARKWAPLGELGGALTAYGQRIYAGIRGS